MNTHNHQRLSQETSLETCNSLMRGELAAAETYRHVLEQLGTPAPEEITACLQSHDQRATLLAEHITLTGGTPVSGRSLWGAFVLLAEGGAAGIGACEIYAILEEGEDQGLTDYRAALANVDAPGLLLLRKDLLPEQIRTHGLMSALCLRCS